MKPFVLRTEHKPLEWLVTVFDAHGLLQGFCFRISRCVASLMWGLRNPVWEPNHEGELEEEVPDLDDEEEFKTLDIHPNYVQAISLGV